MSGNRHPDLDRFYEALEAEGDDDDFFPDPDDEDDELDEEEDDDFDMYLDEVDDDDIEEGDFYLESADEDDEDDEGGDPRVMIDIEDEGEDADIQLSGQTWLNLAELINSSRGAGMRSSLLQQLLAAPNARAAVEARRSMNDGPPIDPVERARRLAERRRKERWWKPQVEPHPRGKQLMQSGEFGRVGPWRRGLRGARVPLRHQQLTTRAQATVPNTNGTIVASYPSIPYVGQYAGEDYSIFYAATQYYTLHLYNTSQTKSTPRRAKPTKEQMTRHVQPSASTRVQRAADDDEEEEVELYPWGGGYRRPRGMTEDSSLKKIKNVQGVEGNWTITDCDADKKAEKMIYSSITPYVHMLYTAEDESDHVLLDFSSHRRGRYIMEDDVSSIWSIRFSADGKEVVAGAGRGKIMVYDIEAQTRSLSVSGHADDVNAVSFADESSTNILVSGSDDGYVKVWDRRSLSSSTPSGVLVGATEGITYTSPKGDGRYIVVNSKDQAARLYDLRKMRSWSEFDGEYDAVSKYGQAHYDYRNSRYPAPSRLAHPKDCSVMTYRGHSVLRTLIRCHFSPRESTGQNYIYSGSADGMIHIWSLDGRVVQVLNRAQSLPLKSGTRPGDYTDPSAPEPGTNTPRYSAMPGERGQSWTVRDVSWHGYEPTLMSTCWEVDGGYRRGGTLAKHEWKGLGKGGLRRLEDWVEREVEEQGVGAHPGGGRAGVDIAGMDEE